MALHADAVILATGSAPIRARLDGSDKDALTVHEVLEGKADGCKRVLIVDRDGHAPAFVAADHLRSAGVAVTFVAAMARAGADLGERDAAMLCQLLADHGVTFMVGHDLARVNGANGDAEKHLQRWRAGSRSVRRNRNCSRQPALQSAGRGAGWQG